MKKIIIILALLVVPFLPSAGYIDAYAESGQPATTVGEEKSKGTFCPAYPSMMDKYTCFECHASGKNFAIKEKTPHDKYSYPNFSTKIIAPGFGYFLMDDIKDTQFIAALEYFKQHNIKHVIIEINNYGGGVFTAWRIIGHMQEAEKKHGMVFETRVYGYAMSAAGILLVAGTPGHRYATATATLMLHELWTFS